MHDRVTREPSSLQRQLASLPPGTKATGRLLVGHTASGQELTVPYLIARGATTGPGMWVNGAVHGDEVNGVLAAIEFFRGLAADRLSGTVVVTPVANILGLDDRRKNGTLDDLDMDQSFPGRADGLPTQRIAARILAEAHPLADAVINLHTMGAAFDSQPYAVYKDHPGSSATESRLLSLIACFGPSMACRMPVTGASGELPGNITGGLDYQSLVLGKAAFMIELGGGSRQELEYIKAGADGLSRLAQELGLLPADGAQAKPRELRRVTRRRHVMAGEGGFFRMASRPGALLKAGEPLGVIHDVFGETVERVTFDQDVIVIGIRKDPVVHAGDRVGFVALEWDSVSVDA